jgi:TatA/E family protein of Tat protein translocase
MSGMVLAFGGSPTELWVILGVVVLLFGGTFLPKFARGLGEAKRELRRLEEEEGDS